MKPEEPNGQEIVRRPSDEVVVEVRSLRAELRQMKRELGFQIHWARRLEMFCVALGARDSQLDTMRREARQDLGMAGV